MQLTVSAPATVLGANLKAEWDARAGTAANTWTDSVAGAVLTGSNSPTFGVDTGFFNGLSVWQLTGSGNQKLDTGQLGAELVAAGTPIYVCLIVRHTLIAASQRVIRLFQSADTQSYIQNLGSSGIFPVTINTPSGLMTSTYAANTSSVHRYEFGLDGTFGWTIVNGRVRLKQALAMPNLNVQRVILPFETPTTTAIIYAAVRIADVWPTGLQREQMRAYDRSVFGTL